MSCNFAGLAAIPRLDAVIHSDLHFFNMCLADDGAITDVWDLGESGLDDAATELLYVHARGSRFVERVLAASVQLTATPYVAPTCVPRSITC